MNIESMLTYKDIVKDGDKVLREKSIDVQIPLTTEDKSHICNMYEYLYNSYDPDICKKYDIHPGVGIAAPQIGLSKKMLCILAYDEEGNPHSYCMINPKIVSHSVERTYLESGEGCLSVIKEHKGYIHRYKRVKVRTYLYDCENDTLSDKIVMLRGYLSVVFQHEFDHLNGILFYDHINKDYPFSVPEDSSPVIFKNSDDE